jgi:GMP synthase (glutamine-hydrolysing)
VKPFLLLGTRADDTAADDEYEAFLRFSGLAEAHLRRVRLERAPLRDHVGEGGLTDWSGVVLGGSPFNWSDPEDVKSPVQRRVEADLGDLLDRVVAADFPFLGACYGVGSVGIHQGAVVDRTFAEPVGAVPVTLTGAGRRDPVFGALPATFDAFVGHKEAVRELPDHAVRLASSPTCPVQAFRIGRHVYATQFHPELDVAGLCTRIDVYRHAGYFHPHEADDLKARARTSDVRHPPALLRRFVEVFGAGPAGGGEGRSPAG